MSTTITTSITAAATVVVGTVAAAVMLVVIVVLMVVLEEVTVVGTDLRQFEAELLDLALGERDRLDRPHQRSHPHHHVHLDMAVDDEVARQAVATAARPEEGGAGGRN